MKKAFQSSEVDPETESELEIPMTQDQYAESISFKFGKVKVAAKPGKAKVAAEVLKRIIVGAMVYAMTSLPFYLGPCALFIVQLYVMMQIASEAYNLKSKPFEEANSYKLLWYITLVLTNYILLPTVGGLRRQIMEKSGFSSDFYPMTFALLYDYHGILTSIFLSFALIILVLSWRERNLRF